MNILPTSLLDSKNRSTKYCLVSPRVYNPQLLLSIAAKVFLSKTVNDWVKRPLHFININKDIFLPLPPNGDSKLKAET